MPDKYEAGKSYNTEKGGVVGPLRQGSADYAHCGQKNMLHWARHAKWWEFGIRAQHFSWCECGEPEYCNPPGYGRLTTEATPTVEGGETE